jgi:hypothetical protein
MSGSLILISSRALVLAATALLAHPATSVAGGGGVARLPPSMIGEWGWAELSCANPDDDGRVRVKPNSVEFFASSYRLERIVARQGGAVRASASTSEEGEAGASRGTIELRLVSPTRLSIWTGSAGGHVYLRCAR